MDDSLPVADDVPKSGRLAGIDYGTVRIGVAISDSRQTLASPHETLNRRDLAEDEAYFKRLTSDESIVAYVVGLPVHLDGRESQKSAEAREFGKWLNQVTGRPVRFFDERFTTSEADQYLNFAQLTKKQRKGRLDMLAAQIMLSAFLESNRENRDQPRSIDG